MNCVIILIHFHFALQCSLQKLIPQYIEGIPLREQWFLGSIQKFDPNDKFYLIRFDDGDTEELDDDDFAQWVATVWGAPTCTATSRCRSR